MTYDLFKDKTPSPILGLTVEEAIEKFSMDVRVVLDEHGYRVVTKDYKPTRFNVETRDGKIFKILSIG